MTAILILGDEDAHVMTHLLNVHGLRGLAVALGSLEKATVQMTLQMDFTRSSFDKMIVALQAREEAPTASYKDLNGIGRRRSKGARKSGKADRWR